MIFPKDAKEISLFSIMFNANGFFSVRSNFFVFGFKLSIFFGILIWFFTEKRWYRYALLSSVIILANQLFNMLWTEGDILDEFELSQSGFFLSSVLILLLLISHAANNQEKIKDWLANRYSLVETKLKEKYSVRDNKIIESRKKIEATKTKLTDLEQLKIELEEELRAIESG
jgi:plasmid maintenance system killer protein